MIHSLPNQKWKPDSDIHAGLESDFCFLFCLCIQSLWKFHQNFRKYHLRCEWKSRQNICLFGKFGDFKIVFVRFVAVPKSNKTDASFFKGLMQRNFFFKVSKQLSHKNPVVHYANKDDGCKFPKLACFVKNICILSAFISVHFFKICFLNIFFKVCNRSPNFPCN